MIDLSTTAAWLADYARTINENADYLTDLGPSVTLITAPTWIVA